MTNPHSSVLAYELTTLPTATTRASVAAISLAILDDSADARVHVWIVALTAEQALVLRNLPWILTPRQLGEMRPTADGESLTFLDLGKGQTYTVSVDALAW